VDEVILKCEIKFKKVTCHALIGGCKTGVIHPILIESILNSKVTNK
jgi:hypothetical protein